MFLVIPKSSTSSLFLTNNVKFSKLAAIILLPNIIAISKIKRSFIFINLDLLLKK